MKTFLIRFFAAWGEDLAAGEGIAWGMVGLGIVILCLIGLGVADLICGWRRERAQNREQAAREQAHRAHLAAQRQRMNRSLADFRLPDPPVPRGWGNAENLNN